MVYGVQPECILCKTKTSTLWRKNEKNEIVCSECLTKGNQKEDTGSDQQAATQSGNGNRSQESTSTTSSNSSSLVLRKSARTKVAKQKAPPAVKSTAPGKGKGRRIIFKKSATKAPTAVASVVTTSSVFHKGSYFQIGDIVSMVDVEGDVYYAQIRGLLQDQYCEKSAVITWLLPSEESPKDHFDPVTYILGPEEEIPRKLDCMEFICHAPSEYFKAKNSPYATVSEKPDLCFIWTRLRPQIKSMPKQDDVFTEA